MHTRPEDLADKDRNFSLFVRLPTARTVCLRHLGRVVTVAEIRDRLEVLAGLPCQLYHISPPGGAPLGEEVKVTFGRDLRNGAILKTRLEPRFEALFNTVNDNVEDPDVIYSTIIGKDVQKKVKDRSSKGQGSEGAGKRSRPMEDGSNAERSFLMLYLSSHYGHHRMCKTIIKLDPEGPSRTTHFGRTALHAAAANDQLKVVQLLLSHQGSPLSPVDVFGKTPLEYSREQGAYTCERTLRFKVLMAGKEADDRKHHQGGSLKNSSKTGWKEDRGRVHIKVKGVSDRSEEGGGGLSPGLSARGGVAGEEEESAARSGARAHGGGSQDNPVSNQPKVKAEIPEGPPPTPRTLLEPALCGNKPHTDCYKRPAFVAVKKIPLAEQKLVTVEFTPMERPKTPQGHADRPVRTVMEKHAWAERVVRSKAERRRQSRTQSATYYKTKYHQQEEDSEYRERPATAGPRFRFWKTWMLEKLEQEAITEEIKKQDDGRRQRNMAAYRRWLAKKEREDARTQREEESESSEEEDNLGYGNWPSPREMAFKKWLESKRSLIVQMTRRKQAEEHAQKEESSAPRRKDIYDRRLTVFEIGCTDPTPIKQPPVDKYITSYKTWLAKKKRYEEWKEKHNVQVEGEDGTVTPNDLDAARYTFFMEGMTYSEWLGMKHREGQVQKQKQDGQK